MNWIVKGKVAQGIPLEQLFSDFSCCEHVEADPSLAVAWSKECDVFGPDDPHVVCQECYNQQQEELVYCDDCGNEVPVKDTIEWKWLEFDYHDGDEPICVCSRCQLAERHLARVKKDKEKQEDLPF